jgi:RND family efflux transporter MFP subunit
VKKIFFPVLIVSFLLIGCGGSDSNEPSKPSGGGWGGWGSGNTTRATSVETQTVSLQSIAEQVRSFGTIQAQNVIAITPQISNTITNFYVDLGDTVKAGQLLAKINNTTFKDQLAQAEAQLMQSEIAVSRDSAAYSRAKMLAEKELSSIADEEIAEANYQSSLAALESAKASLTQAKENVSFTEVRSPVNGVILSKIGEEGDVASSAQALFEIANLVGYETRVFLPVQDWRFVKIGQPVNLRVSNETESSAVGIISRKSPQLDPTTGLGEVVVSLTNTGPNIFPGVLTENVIDIDFKEQTIVVPRSALVEKVETTVEPESNTITLAKTYSVFVSVGDTTAELRSLKLGIEQGDKIEIIEGLNAGESIIVTGQTSLKDGAKIRVATGANFTSPEGTTVSGSGSWGAGTSNSGAGGWSRGTTTGATNDSTTSETVRRTRRAGANMSDDDRRKMRERMQNMNPEERKALMDSIRTANSSEN